MGDPALYQQLLAQADGTDAEAAARRDPDAYVALFLAATEDSGVTIRTEPAWDEAEVVATIELLEPLLTELATNAEGEPLQYPGWAVRTWIKMELGIVLDVMGDVLSDVAGGPNPGLLEAGLSLETHAEIESLYDGVFAVHDLADLVNEVMRRVLLGGADAEDYVKYGQGE